MKKRILDVILLIIGIVIIVTIILIATKYIGNFKNEKEMTNIVEQIKSTDVELPNNNEIDIETNNTEAEVEIDGY